MPPRTAIAPRSLILTTLCLLAPLPALACSGPGAMERMRATERLGWILWGVALALAGVFVAVQWARTRVWWKQWPYLLFVLIHPGWWMSVYSGDCGATVYLGSIAMTAATAVGGGLILWLTLRRAARRANPD